MFKQRSNKVLNPIQFCLGCELKNVSLSSFSSSPPPGTTEKTLIEVLTQRSNAQRLLIAKAYEKATGRVK